MTEAVSPILIGVLVALAVVSLLPGRRNQRGDVTDQLQRREDDLGAPVRTRQPLSHTP